MPPFSLAGAAVITLDPHVPLVLDYRDPWSARHAPPLLARATRTTGLSVALDAARSQREVCERLHHADPAVVVTDHTSAVESRIPAKVYDYLATGIPVIAVCPPGAALLQIPEARRFHHIHHRDVNGLAALLRHARCDRTILCAGTLGEGPTRERGIEALHTTLHALLPRP
ncbi:MAG: hypothetical protein ACRDSL_16265 [Pseudonocardiaceae bacterium]